MINRVSPFFLLFFLVISCKGKDVVEKNIFLKDFSWHIQISRNSMNFNSIEIIDNYLYLSNFQSNRISVYSVDGDIIANKTKIVYFKQDRFIWDYQDAQTSIIDSVKGETSTYYPIIMKDSSVVVGLKLEAYRKKNRGVNNEYALCFNDVKGVKYKLMFPSDENKGAITVYDVVSYDATRLVISFWYYERWGVSNTQLGVLDLSQYIKD